MRKETALQPAFDNSKPTEPLVTIGIPTYNRVESLRRAVASALAQDYRNLEIVISDNTSTDGTEAFCRELCSQDARVRYVRHAANRGAFANFVSVLGEARGEFWMWLADDDWLDPDYVSQCAGFLTKHPDYSLACGRSEYRLNGEVVGEGEPLNLVQESGTDRVLSYFQQVKYNGVYYSLMRREQALRAPLRLTLGGDWLVIAGLAFLGKVRILEEVAIYRSSGGVGADLFQTVRSLKLPRWQAVSPHFSIALIVLADIGWTAEIYRPLGPRRLALACRAFALLFRKIVAPAWMDPWQARWWNTRQTAMARGQHARRSLRTLGYQISCAVRLRTRLQGLLRRFQGK